jgi:hypothetical protein
MIEHRETGYEHHATRGHPIIANFQVQLININVIFIETYDEVNGSASI